MKAILQQKWLIFFLFIMHINHYINHCLRIGLVCTWGKLAVMRCCCRRDIEDGEWQGKNDRGRTRGCAEMQIFARKLITRINSSQNIQTGCQTVRLYTPIPGYEPNTAHPSDANGCAFAGVMSEHERYNVHITCSIRLLAADYRFAGRFYFNS